MVSGVNPTRLLTKVRAKRFEAAGSSGLTRCHPIVIRVMLIVFGEG